MKRFGLFICLALCLVSGLAFNQELEVVERFRHFVAEYDKPYSSPSHPDFAHRLDVFRSNLALIEQLNAEPGQTAHFEINEFGDLSPQEFRARLMPSRPAPRLGNDKMLRLPSLRKQDMPEEFDWKNKGAVAPVRDQGSVGSCYAFSAVQNVEGLNFLAGKPLTVFSPEQIVDCTSGHGDNGDACCGVFGGWPYLVLDYIQHNGVATEQNYPYCSGVGTCYPCAPPGYNKTYCGPYTPYCNATHSHCDALPGPLTTISSWHTVSNNETDMVSALLNVGPLSVCLDANLLQFYKSGIFAPKLCTKTLNHAVLLTGYGSQNGQDYWIVKNSWGTKWGMEGYFWIARGQDMCGINEAVVTGII